MPTNIKCPSCATVFDVENVLSADVEQKIKQQYEKQLQQSFSQINDEKKKLQEEQQLFEEKRKRENELFQQKLQQEKLKMESEIQQQLRKSITADYDNQLRLMQQNIQENEEKLKTARQKEFEYLKKEQDLKNKEQDLEIQLQQKLSQERDQLTQVIRKEEAERIETKHQLERQELEKQLENQRKLTDAEQKIKQQQEKQLQQKEQQLQQSFSQIDEERKKLAEEQRLFEEKSKQENELFQQKLQQEKLKMESEIQQQLRKSITADFDNQLRLLQQNAQENEEKLKTARQKEFEYLKKEQELKSKEQELEIQLQQKLLQERDQLMQVIRKEEAERIMLKETEYQLKLKELEKQLEDQRKLAEEMKRRAEQGSMQLQGEVQELLLEELLKENFPYDNISEVGKGVEGADCIQTVRNHLGTDCGKIIFESKRTKTFQNAWIEKLKADMRSQQADVAIIVTQIYPRDMHSFGEKDGVWICSFSEVVALTTALRQGVIRVSETKKAEENKGEKMQMLYSYLTGTEFRQQIETIVDGFLSMKNAISKERVQMEKIWKEREKHLERVLLSTSGLYGSIKGIAGASIGEIPLLEDSKVEDIPV